MKTAFNKYATLITNNSETTGDVEVLCKYLSYFVSGKLTDNGIITEGLFSLSNLLVLFNDQLIRRELLKRQPRHSVNDTEESIKLFLTILDNVEVLIEVTSKRVLGKKKFAIIFVIQAVKCIGRLLLVLKFKNRISCTPAIEHLNRKNLKNVQSTTTVANELQPELNETSFTLKLKRSGKVIRKVAQAPPIYSRSFKAPELAPNDRFGVFNHQAIKSAEIVYILKPMIHLGAVGAFGYKSWKAYLLSFFLDIFSIRQYYNNRQYLTSDQKKELSRRCVNMMLYILRSPFYDQYSGSKIDAFMRAVSSTVPFAKLIVEPYRQLIPHYQESYFYMWSS